MGVLAYQWEAMEYLCSLNIYVARVSIENRLPFESFWGETPGISMIRFKLWEPVYYRNWTETVGKVLMHPRRFVGFAWYVGNTMTFKVLQCHENTKNQIQILHMGVVVPRYLDVSGYDSDLQPKSDAYLPEVRTEGGTTSKTAPSLHQGILDPPDIAKT